MSFKASNFAKITADSGADILEIIYYYEFRETLIIF
jgi:hypothetical protein